MVTSIILWAVTILLGAGSIADASSILSMEESHTPWEPLEERVGIRYDDPLSEEEAHLEHLVEIHSELSLEYDLCSIL